MNNDKSKTMIDVINSKICDFLGNERRTFIVPFFQRNYSWNKEQCRELLEDFLECLDDHRYHYLGNFIYYTSYDDSDSSSNKRNSSVDEVFLLDGQQRITTILLILTAIRDNTQDTSLKEEIDKKYLKNCANNEYRIKLKTVISDDNDFSKIVGGGVN